MKKVFKSDEQRNNFIIIVSIIFVILILLWKFVLEGYYMFYKLEQEFVNGAENYYETRTVELPKKVGDYKTIKLSKLYETLSVEVLRTPKRETYCDEDSWVRVIKSESGEYVYHHFLQCDKYKSRTDHTGPVIDLKGEDVVYLKVGEEYKDLGIKSVTDDKDGKLKIRDVEIDTSDIDNSKFGQYKVKYIAHDSKKNRTVKERIVKVVMKLEDVINVQTNNKKVYIGDRTDNHILFSGNLWRLVKVNDDNTLMLITEDSVSNLSYGMNDNYDSSNINKWLNDVFYKSLSDSKKLIKKDSTFCIDQVSDYKNIKKCSSYSKPRAVGLIDIATINQTLENDETFLNSFVSYWLSNEKSHDSAWTRFIFSNNKEHLVSNTKDKYGAVRPVINIKLDDLYLIEGTGTKTSPFKLNDYEYGKVGTTINKRLPGEYLKISGYFWKISEVDKNGNTKIIMNEVVRDLTNNTLVGVEYTNSQKVKKFNSKQHGNLGYKINTDIIKFVNDKLFVEATYDIPKYDEEKKYDALETYEEKVKFSVPRGSDLHSGTSASRDLATGRYFLADYVDRDYRIMFVNEGNGFGFVESSGDFGINNVKLVGYLNKDVKIASGNGTLYSPYFVR